MSRLYFFVLLALLVSPELSAQPSSLSSPQLKDQQCVPAGPRVALTFDDGPFPGSTTKILSDLDAAGARGTFFLVGKNAANYPSLVREIARAGSEIGVHTQNHANLARASARRQESEIEQGWSSIEKADPGLTLRLWRAPYGAWPVRSIAAVLAHHLTRAAWTIDTDDWQRPSLAVWRSRILGRLNGHRSGEIVLMHEFAKDTLTGLPDLLLTLRTRGYNMVSVSGLAAPTCHNKEKHEVVVVASSSGPQ
jgi:peptidoglycan/xylan/chitin deacetylase (PgdA/CDA1 family)